MVGNPTTGTVPDSDLNTSLNNAYLEIIGKFPFHESRVIANITTVAGVREYDLPAGTLIIHRIWDATNSRKLHKRGTRFLASWNNDIPDGQPRNYVRLASTIMFFPTPDGIYTIEGSGIAGDELLNDTDEPLIPVTWHYGICLRARWYHYDARGDVGKAIYASNTWKDWLSDKPSEIDEEKVDLEDRGVIISTLGGEHGRRGPVRDLRYDENFDREDWR
jgi:hypothetical protein